MAQFREGRKIICLSINCHWDFFFSEIRSDGGGVPKTEEEGGDREEDVISVYWNMDSTFVLLLWDVSDR